MFCFYFYPATRFAIVALATKLGVDAGRCWSYWDLFLVVAFADVLFDVSVTVRAGVAAIVSVSVIGDCSVLDVAVFGYFLPAGRAI